MSSWGERISEGADELAAGDEVEQLGDDLAAQFDSLRQEVRNLRDDKPTAYSVVPSDSDRIALPSGTATIDFENGTVTHEAIDGLVSEDVVTIDDLSRRFEKESLVLRSFLFYTDTHARASVGGTRGQQIDLDFTPIPTPRFREVEVELDRPGNLFALAATKPLNMGLGTIAVIGTRIGEHSGTLDSYEPIPVSPYELYDEHGGAHAEATVDTSRYTAATWTIANQSGNGNEIDVDVQGASADPSEYADAEWRTLEEVQGVPDGDHVVIEVTQEHKLMRPRVANSVAGNNVDAKVELTEGTP